MGRDEARLVIRARSCRTVMGRKSNLDVILSVTKSHLKTSQFLGDK